MFGDLSYFRKKTTVRILSIVLLHAFLFYNIASAAPSGNIYQREQKDTLAPYLISQLISDPTALEGLITEIESDKGNGTPEDAERIRQRAEAIKLGWVRKHILPYLLQLQTQFKEFDKSLGQDFYQKMFSQGVELGIKKLRSKTPGKYHWLITDIELLAKNEIGRLFEEGGVRSPGTGAMRFGVSEAEGQEFPYIPGAINTPYTDEEHLRENLAIADTIRAGGARMISDDFAECIFVVLKDKVYERYAEKHGAPIDLVCHPGTHGSRAEFDPDDPGSYAKNVRKYYYVRESLFRKLSPVERLTLAMHEEMHIRIALGIEKLPREYEDMEDGEEKYINSIPRCDIRKIMADRLDSVAHMREFLVTDTNYGDAAGQHILYLEGQGRLEEAEKFMREVYKRRRNIIRMKSVLTEEPYQGYDVVIISSSTPEEAEYQKKVLEEAFKDVYTQNAALNNKVCILSVVDESFGGQVIGQLNTWVKAKEAFKGWAGDMSIHEHPFEADDLDELFQAGRVKMAIYHNGGKGERASPATQSLGNSRGAQKLVGQVFGPKDEPIDLELILSVVLETNPIATSNNGARIDTFWANQLAFGTIDFAQLKRSNAGLDKLVVRIPENPRLKDLYDYGTAILADDGAPVKFLANKVLTMKDPNSPTGEYMVNPDYRRQYDELMAARHRVFDYGSFSISRDMHYALMEYWRDVKGVFRKMEANGGSAGISRDIEPAFVQILVPLVNGLKGRALPDNLPASSDLRSMTSTEMREEVLERAYGDLLQLMEGDHRRAIEIIYKKDKQPVLESIEFFLLYRDMLFKDMGKVFGHVDLGENSHWFAYKRLLDMANEKFIMLSDILGERIELKADGEITRAPAEIDDKIKAEDARRMRRIRQNAIAVFEVNGEQAALTLDDVKRGVEIHGVYVKGSIIRGRCSLLPGSRIVNSVVNDSQGLITAENAYIESSTAPEIEARNSIVYIAIHQRKIEANKEILADVYRPEIRDERFTEGQTRMRAPAGYDPKPAYKNVKDRKDMKPSDPIEDFVIKVRNEDNVQLSFYVNNGIVYLWDSMQAAEMGEYKRAVPVADAKRETRKSIWKGSKKIDCHLVRDLLLLGNAFTFSPKVEKGLRKVFEQGEYWADDSGKFVAKPGSDFEVFGENKYAFHEIRIMECNRSRNDEIENCARVKVMVIERMRPALERHISFMASKGLLTTSFVDRIFSEIRRIKPDSRTRTEMIFFCNLLERYGDETIKHDAGQERNALLENVYQLGPTVDPNIYRRDSVRANAGVELPSSIIKAAGIAYVDTLAELRGVEAQEITLAVGRESRESGERIINAFIEGCLLAGAKVIDVTDGGNVITSTPIMYFASRYLQNERGDPIDGMVEVTASHLPGSQNGLKSTAGPINFTTEEMQKWLEKTHDVIDRGIYIEEVAQKVRESNVTKESVLEVYYVLLVAALEGSDNWIKLAEEVLKGEISLRLAVGTIQQRAERFMESKPLAGMKLTADSGFGSMGPIVRGILTKLGAELTDIGPEADYSKAFHDANPNNPDNLEALLGKVKEIASVLGMAFDVDGDRLGVVTLDGKILRGDDISCIIAPVVIKEAIERARKAGIKDFHPVIIVNVLCSDRLKKVIRDAGGVPIECAVGFNKVKEAMVESYKLYLQQYPEMKDHPEITPDQQAEMGVEISSHIMFRENFNADDAFFAVVKLLGILVKKAQEVKDSGEEVPADLLDVMLKDLPADHHTGEWRTPMMSNELRKEVAGRIREHYQRMAEEYPDRYKVRNEIDGVKIDFLRNGESVGFLAVRPSGTSPEMVVVVNSLTGASGLNMIKNDFFGQLKRFRDYVRWDKTDAKTGEKKPALEPGLYYEQARGFVFDGKRLPVANDGRKADPGRPAPRTPGTGAVRMGEERKIPSTEDIILRADLFYQQISHMLERHPYSPLILAFDTDLGKQRQHAQIQEVALAIRALSEMQKMLDDHGRPKYPLLRNVAILSESGESGDLAQEVLMKRMEVSQEKKDLDVFTIVVTRKTGVDKNFGEIKEDGNTWISAIDDRTGNDHDYMPVFEAATLAMMAIVDPADIGRIKDFYNSIAKSPIDDDILKKMLEKKMFYVLPKISAMDPGQLRKLYENVRKIYLAA
ncbi:MAG: hypothetical protein WBC16_03705 [Candidatus Omnitrophota bacterium]